MKISTWIPVAAVAFNAAFAGGGQPPDTCYFDAGLRGVALDKTLTRPDDAFLVRKLYDGEHSVPTDLSTVELAIYSEAAANPDAHGGCLTYLIEGEGIDMTGNTDDNGERFKLDGIYDIAQQNHYMVEFDDAGWTRITAKLKEGSVIRVTGEFGPFNPEYAAEAPNGRDRRKTLSTAGLLQGQTFYVIERSTPFGNGYEPTGYVYEGDDDAADPRVDATGMTAMQKLSQDIADETDPIPDDQPSYTPATVPAGALFLKGTATRSATTVFVVNRIDESKVGFIDVDVTDWDAPYDGRGHGAAVTMLSTFSDDDGEPLYDWWRASYALGDAEGPTNDWSAGTPLFTNVCEQTVWMAFDADYWRSTTTSAVVRIRPAALAITARDQTYVYNGRPQGEGDPVYTDPADIAAKVDVEGLAAGDALASIVLTGQRTEPGTEWIVPSGAVVTNATGDVTSNYDIGYTNGTLTIGAPAPPSVSNVVARQRWPWNGLVDVDYEVGGTTTGLVARISFAEQGGEGRAWVATNFLAGAEPSAEPGFHRATWDTAADGATNVVAGSIVATVTLVNLPYVVRYDGNGGAGVSESQKKRWGETFRLNENPFSCEDFLFMAWNTAADGSGVYYTNRQEVADIGPPGGGVTLFACWVGPDYTIQFDANGGVGEMADQTATRGVSTKLNKLAFRRENAYFKGWNTKPDGTGVAIEPSGYVTNPAPYVEGSTLSFTDEVTLYAQWRSVTAWFRIDFESNGGTWLPGHGLDITEDYQWINLNQFTKLRPVPYGREGFRFAGWNTKPDGTGVPYEDQEEVYNVSGDYDTPDLFAQWEPVDP